MDTRRHPVIRVEGMTRTYAIGQMRVHALRGVSLRIERGEYVAIMGPSGSGKSTLMNMLGCLDAPTEGRYLLDGVDVAQPQRGRAVGPAQPQDRLRLPGLQPGPADQRSRQRRTAARLRLPAAPREARRAEAALEAVGMGDRGRHSSAELSGGQQQRVAIARAIVTNPALILADEPTGNLDSRSTAEVLGIFEDLNRSGRTVVMITHEDHVAAHAERLIRLADGRVVSDLPVAEDEVARHAPAQARSA